MGLGILELAILGICLLLPLGIVAVILARWFFVARPSKEREMDERVEREDIDD